MAISQPDFTPAGSPDVLTQARHLTEVPQIAEPDPKLKATTSDFESATTVIDPYEFIPPEQVQGIGYITCIASRFVQAPHGVFRKQQLLLANTDYGPQLARITHPGLHDPATDKGTDPDNVITLLGFSEMVEHGTGKRLHDELANQYPFSLVGSLATEGVSAFGPRLGFKEGWSKKFDEMAAARLLLIRALGGNGTTTLVPTSMSSVIVNHMAIQNMYAQEDGLTDSINLASIINVSHALMPRQTVVRDVGKFLLHMPVSGAKKALQHRNEAIGLMPVARALPRSVPGMAGNVRNLLEGSDWSDVAVVASTYPMGFIIGELDPLRQLEHCIDLAEHLPDSVKVKICDDEGHALSLDGQNTAREVVDMQRMLAVA